MRLVRNGLGINRKIREDNKSVSYFEYNYDCREVVV